MNFERSPRLTGHSVGGRVVYYYTSSFALKENGSQVRAWEILSWLVRTFSSVTVYSFRNWPSHPWREEDLAQFKQDFPTVELVLENRTKPLEMATRVKNLLLTVAPRRFSACLGWRLPGRSPALDSIKETSESKVYIINYADGMAHLNGIDPARCIVEVQDVKFALYARRARKPIYNARVVGKLRNEAAMLEHTAGLIAIAQTENLLYKLWFPEKPVFHIAKFPYSVIRRRETEKFAYDLLFVGSLWLLNNEGIVNFLLDNRSWIASLRIAIAGKVCLSPEVQEAARGFRNVKLFGFVEDLGDLYACSKVVISPVSGTGLKIKTVEALQYGKPVLASEHTINGLPSGFSGCVFPIEEDTAMELLTDDLKLRAASAAALKYAVALADLHEIARLRNLILEKLAGGVSSPDG